MEPEASNLEFVPVRDTRPSLPEPPPVRLVSIDDIRLPAAAGLETPLDAFYVERLRFSREGADAGRITYKSENARLLFDVREPPIVREDFRPVGVEVPLLLSLELQLIEEEIAYQWQKGLAPGSRAILLQDPAGNWLQISEFKRV